MQNLALQTNDNAAPDAVNVTHIKNALVVDDDPLLSGILEAYLTKIGVTSISTAEDGSVALSILEKDGAGFNLICCDLNMPNLDGIAMLSRISECGFAGDVIIISSEHDAIRRTAEDFAHEIGLNVLGSLKKPFDPRQFDALIAKGKKQRKPVARSAAHDYPPEILFAEHGGIVPFYQPQVCARTGVIVGVETLARLRLEDDSVVSPFHFMESIEANDLWFALFERMFKKSTVELAEWQKTGHDVRLSVNVDAKSLCESSLPDLVRSMTAAAQIDPSRIVLELTEEAALDSTARMLEVLARLRLFGFGVSIDDFGMGYSNFERLRRMPFTELKIDRQFVINAQSDPISAACVTSSVALARAGGFATVAEGVETELQRDFVRAAGIDMIQGFYYSEPLSANAFRRFIKAFAPDD